MKQSNARAYRERATICTRLADQAVSDEATARLFGGNVASYCKRRGGSREEQVAPSIW